MPNLVEISDFVGERSIPNSGDRNVMEKLNLFIEKYEPICLQSILGWALYQEYLAEDPIVEDSIIDKLVNGTEYDNNLGTTSNWIGLKPLVVDYVYFYYMSDAVSVNTGKMVVLPQVDAGYNLSPAQKMVSAWNEFVRHVRSMTFYLTADSVIDTYPNYSLEYARNVVCLTAPINEFDI